MCDPGRKPLRPCNSNSHGTTTDRVEGRGNSSFAVLASAFGVSQNGYCTPRHVRGPLQPVWRLCMECVPITIDYTLYRIELTSTRTMAPPRLTAITGPSNTTSFACISCTFAHAFSYWIRRMETWTFCWQSQHKKAEDEKKTVKEVWAYTFERKATGVWRGKKNVVRSSTEQKYMKIGQVVYNHV